jgi:predicted nucleotide-binding protein (sugar kinase/HSP70/actin superfamily)
MAGSVLNSMKVLRLNFCAKRNICASISATSPSCKPLAVIASQDISNMKNIFYLIFILFFYSCSTTRINYSTKKISQLERKGYIVNYNDKVIQFNNFFIDKSNIKKVIKSNNLNSINIIPKNSKSEFINGKKLVNQILIETNKTKFDLIVISGIPYSFENLENIEIEKKLYENYKILSEEELSNNTMFCRRFDNGILLIILKE